MSIFALHSAVLADYRDFVRSFLLIRDERVPAFVDKALDEEARLWPGRGRTTWLRAGRLRQEPLLPPAPSPDNS